MKRLFVLFAFLVSASAMLYSQGVQITGTVTDAENGEALPGVSVVVKGTTIGAVTDFEGNYTISVPNTDALLVFSFVGMESQTITVGSQTTIDVQLNVDAIKMDEVVVIGYGTSTREANTGAVTILDEESLQDVPELSFDKMLAGKAAGVQVTSTSGQPGAASQIRIRGTSSLNAGNEPLYVVDGIPIMQGNQTYFTNTGNALAMINPNDIESITILKDAAAASVYGSRAANGVVLITTKSGKQGKSTVNLRATYGVTSLANDNDYRQMTGVELVGFMQDASRNAGYDPLDPASGSYYVPNSLLDQDLYNWMDEVTRYGSIQEYELGVTGGNEKTSHYTSGLYSSTDGVFYGIDYKKYQIRSNITHRVSDRFKMGVRFNAFRSEANDVAMQSLYYVNPMWGGMNILPWTSPKNEDGTWSLDIPENLNLNPLATAEYDDQWEIQNRLQGTFFLEYEPIPGLKFKTNNAVEYTDGEGRRYWSPEADFAGNATLQTSRTKYSQLTSSNTVSYNKYFNNHDISVLGGAEIISNANNSYYIYTPDVDPSIPFPNTGVSDTDEGDYGESKYNMASFFGILDYNYASKYYLRLSYRTDGSSRFGENNRWGQFYSVGASWNLHNESFMEGVGSINLLKLRASYGVNGNDRIGNYEHWGVYGPTQYNGLGGMAPSQPANPDLTWETNTTYNFGLDFGFMKRFSGSVEYYYRETTDMLLDVPLSRTSGFTSLRQNIGILENKGVEAILNVDILNGPVLWDFSFNIAANRSKIVDLGTEEQIIVSSIIYKVGEPLYSYYLYQYAGVNPVNGMALWKNDDGELSENFSDATKKIMGSPEPDFIGGFNTNVSWEGITLSASFEYKIGNKVLIKENRYLNSDGYNWGNNVAYTNLEYWKQPGDITRNPKPIANNTTNSATFHNPRWMYDGDYLRVKNVTLSYTLPAEWTRKAKIESLRIYGSAVNLWTFHDVDFFDPERGIDGMGYGIYPISKSFVIGLDLTF
ncbi:MAG: TonB-dependent receptor [Bacteroidota bacterium]|nr:TonB-dependent receptor [Bacteroidota bacterium]